MSKKRKPNSYNPARRAVEKEPHTHSNIYLTFGLYCVDCESLKYYSKAEKKFITENPGIIDEMNKIILSQLGVDKDKLSDYMQEINKIDGELE